MTENDSEQKLIGVDDISNREDQFNETRHGFLNGLYERMYREVGFQLGTSRVEFNLAYSNQVTGRASERTIELDVPILTIFKIVHDYFGRHPDIFLSFFPEYTGQVIEPYVDNDDDEDGSRMRSNPLQHALSGIRRASLTNRFDSLAFQRLTPDIWERIGQDSISRNEVNDLMEEMVETVIHEHAHQVLMKLGGYYGFEPKGLTPVIKDEVLRPLIEKETFQNEVTKLRQKTKDDSDPNIFQKTGMDYLRLLIDAIELSNRDRAYAAKMEYIHLQFLWGMGIQEIVIRLIEASMKNLSPEAAIAKLNNELFKTSVYYLKPLGIIFPKPDEIIPVIEEVGIEKAFHQILAEYYNTESFENWLKDNFPHVLNNRTS